MTVSLRQAWIGLIAGAILLGLVPGGLALDRRLAAELEERARSELAMAPKILADRNAGRSDALMMRAKELSGRPELARALLAGDRQEALVLARAALSAPDEEPVVVGPEGSAWSESAPDSATVAETRQGRMPVVFGHRSAGHFRLSLAPVQSDGRWAGAVGVLVPLGSKTTDELAALTRSEVVLIGIGGNPTAASTGSGLWPALSDSAAAWSGDSTVHEMAAPSGERYWATVTPLGDAGHALFLRDVAGELALLPDLRRSALLAVGIALGVALLLGGLLAARMSRPVRALSRASERLADGDFSAPVPSSRIREIDSVGRAFREMRSSLSETIAELREANWELQDRQARLQSLQSELIQRDRAAATGRLVTELAHEIRNPVASVRNCLELIHRRLDDDSELREFSSMAVEELMRMHRLAEQMLDANRPLDPEARAARPGEVATKVAELSGMARAEDGASVEIRADGDPPVAIPPDALKQVLLNLIENAREAIREAGSSAEDEIEVRIAPDRGEDGFVTVEVLDSGPGLDGEAVSRAFDPFYTTKEEVHGVGLGLFVAQGLVRRHGGSIEVSNREAGGARFTVRLPAADPEGTTTGGDEERPA